MPAIIWRPHSNVPGRGLTRTCATAPRPCQKGGARLEGAERADAVLDDGAEPLNRGGDKSWVSGGSQAFPPSSESGGVLSSHAPVREQRRARGFGFGYPRSSPARLGPSLRAAAGSTRNDGCTPYGRCCCGRCSSVVSALHGRSLRSVGRRRRAGRGSPRMQTAHRRR